MGLYQRKQNLTEASLGEEIALMNVQTGKYHTLNRVASVIWELLADKSTIESLMDTLTEKYDVEVDICREEVEGFLYALMELKLVELTEGE